MKIYFIGSVFEFTEDGVCCGTSFTSLDVISKNRLIDWLFLIGGMRV